MPIPGYQDFMLPLLRVASDGGEHTVSTTMELLAKQMSISDVDRDIVLPSGTQTRFYNRVTWAITYLTKSLLLEKCGRGRFRLTERGRSVLAGNPTKIDSLFLEQFPEYLAFKTKKNDPVTTPSDTDDESEPDVTPDERLDSAYKELRGTLADDLIERVRGSSPKFFEHLV